MALLESDFDFIDIPVFDWELTGRDESEFDFVGAVAGSSGDGAAPVVTLVSPLTGQVEGAGALIVDVTDNVQLGRVFVVVRFPAIAREELVNQGERFTPDYNGQSTREPIAGGYRFTLRRSGGWPASPLLDVYAVDASGTEG